MPKQTLLEKFIAGIPSTSINPFFEDPLKRETQIIYLLPIIIEDDFMKGFSVIDGKLKTNKIGFSFNYKNQTNRFQIINNSISKIEDDTTIYLPLEETILKNNSNSNKNFNNHTVLGINGEEGKYPIVYCLNSKENQRYHYFVYDKKDLLEEVSITGKKSFNILARNLINKMDKGEITRTYLPYQEKKNQYFFSIFDQSPVDKSNWTQGPEPDGKKVFYN